MGLSILRLIVGQMSPGDDDRKKIKLVFLRKTAGIKQRIYESVLG